MSLFSRRRPVAVEQRLAQVVDFGSWLPRDDWTGVPVTPDAALTVPAVWKCLMLTAGVIAQLPLDEQQRTEDGLWRTVGGSPLTLAPSGTVSLEDWVFQHVESQILHGGAFGVIVSRDRVGWPTQVELVHPSEVRVRRTDRTLEWQIEGRAVPADDVWHVPGRPMLGTPFGLSLIEFMRRTLAVDLAARRYGAEWFRDAGAPIVVARPQTDPGAENAARIKQRLTEAVKSRSPLVVPQSMQIEQWPGATPSDSAVVELLRQNASDVAAFFAVPPELVGGKSGDSMTYSNIESRMLDLLSIGVGYWLVKFERALSRNLPRPRRAKFNESAIVRTDLRTKTETLVQSVGGPFRTINEARALLDLPPVDGGDEMLVGRRDAGPGT